MCDTTATQTTPIICIYHANCADGFTAAWCVRNALGESNVTFTPASYDDAPPDVAGADVIIVDFSYKRPVLMEMSNSARSILILDHHKSAQQELAGLRTPTTGWAQFQQQLTAEIDHGFEPNWPRAEFDMTRSGAQMAWDFFNDGAGKYRPDLVDYVADRDLWKWELPFSRQASAVIATEQMSFDTWDALCLRLENPFANSDFRAVVSDGTAILRYQHKLAQQIIATTTREMTIGGHRVPVANAPYALASDIAGELAQGKPFAATYTDTPEGRKFSLRSRTGGLDVSEIARSYGGGGHRNAAGFTTMTGLKGLA